jgi:hypothetical protein
MATTPPPSTHTHSNPEPAKSNPGRATVPDEPLMGTAVTPTPPTLPVTTVCPFDGLAASADLAPNPNIASGTVGFGPDLPLPPNWVVSPFANAKIGGLGQWLLIIGTTCRHRTLWNVSRLTELNVTQTPWIPIV